jgi:UTP:GlnB (protein PII) uridylyltransferase
VNLLNIIFNNGRENYPIRSGEICIAKDIIGFITAHKKDFWDIEKYYIETWHQILEYKWSSHILKRLDRLKLIECFFPELDRLKEIPQNKRKTLNAFQHTLKVLNEVDKRHNDIVMKLAALFHDIGKYCYLDQGNFHYHEYYSETITAQILERFPIIIDLDEIKRLLTIIRYHMRPLAYQRQPNWKDSTIINFANEVKDKGGDIVEVINFAICDKLATNPHIKYLEELRGRVINLGL